MAGDKNGRRLKLTPELIEDVTRVIRAGNYAQTACEVVGISTNTYYRWLQMAEEQGTAAIYRDFRDAIKRAEANAEVRTVARIMQAAEEGTWQASAWFLERKHPTKWGRNDKIRQEVTGAEGGPVEVVVDAKKAVLDFLNAGDDESFNSGTDSTEV